MAGVSANETKLVNFPLQSFPEPGPSQNEGFHSQMRMPWFPNTLTHRTVTPVPRSGQSQHTDLTPSKLRRSSLPPFKQTPKTLVIVGHLSDCPEVKTEREKAKPKPTATDDGGKG